MNEMSLFAPERLEVPEVVRNVPAEDRRIYAAACGRAMKDYNASELATRLADVFRLVSVDIGYNIPAAGEGKFAVVRLTEILATYYGEMSVEDVKMAFELCVLGRLDDWLPKDAQGNADRKHYQKFNAEYVAKIMNAYRQRRRGAVGAVKRYLPRPGAKKKDETNYSTEARKQYRAIYLRYKYTGDMVLSRTQVFVLYNFLNSVGLADDLAPSLMDRRKAMSLYMMRASKGLENRYRAEFVRREGVESRELDSTAYEVARANEIIATFDRMIVNEIQIDRYL